MYGHILVPTDGSELAQKGVDHGLTLAKQLGSKVTIITATEPISAPPAAAAGGWVPTPMEYDGYAEHRKEAADRVLAQAKAAAAKMGIEADTIHVPDAWPAEAIVDTAREQACDLIVMASHGRRGIKKVLLGSQTSEVLVSSTVPVLVVR